MSPAEIKKKFLQGILMINNAVRILTAGEE